MNVHVQADLKRSIEYTNRNKMMLLPILYFELGNIYRWLSVKSIFIGIGNIF